jgi:ubiquinone/menaquinone biosynthesis C-methylase UbiE
MEWALDPEEAETRVLHALADFGGKDVLEVGCGNGRLTWRYADRATSILACDPNAGLVEWARDHVPPEWRGRVDFRADDITRMDLPEAAFDIALLAWSIC